MTERTDLMILGLGNVLCGDDGAGIAAVARLRDRWDPPPGVAVLDGGTLGLSLLPYLTAYRQVILVDAVAADAPAGTLLRIAGDEVASAAAHRLSPHQVGVADLLDAARLLGGLPEAVVIVGVVPERIELSVERSPAVEAALDDLVQATLDEAAGLGYPFTRRERGDAEAHPHRSTDRVRGLGL